jgi:tetratricopeptide (TPR) repeat protein
MLSPVTAVFSVIGLAVMLISAEYEHLHPGMYSILAFLALPIILPHWLNLRYVSLLFGPVCLLAGLGWWFCFSKFSQRLRTSWMRVSAIGALVLAAAVVAYGDHQRFQRVFVADALPDLSVKMLVDENGERSTPTNKLTAEDYLSLSLQYHRNKQYRECIDAARQALKLKPDYAEAYNNIAAGYESLQQWDEAIQAAQQALKLKPDFELARNNLLYSLEQKRQAAAK